MVERIEEEVKAARGDKQVEESKGSKDKMPVYESKKRVKEILRKYGGHRLSENNYMLIFGSRPTKMRRVDTDIILEELTRVFRQNYDKLTQTLIFPENLSYLRNSKSKIELVTIPALQKLSIKVKNFRAAKTCAYIFVQDTLEYAQ